MTTQTNTVLEVQGMTCHSCIRHVNQTLEELGGVDKIDVQMRDGLVVVAHDAAAASIDRLISALDEAGYPAKQRAV